MPRDRRRRRKKPSDPVERLGLEIYDRLEALHRELLARRGEAPAPWELELHLATCVHGPERAQSANRFAVQITQHLEEAIAQRLAATAPLMPGHLYCYWCDSASCPHSMPATARTVFTGYEPTGTPRWQDFASLCLELGDARVDELHADPPRPFSVYMSRRTLTADQLSVFGARSRTFRVLLDLLTVLFLRRYGDRPMYLFGSLGLMAGGLGTAVGLYLSAQKVWAGVQGGWPAFHAYTIGERPLVLLAVLLVIVGVQFLVAGLTAELITRTYYESQRKRIYSVREVLGAEGRL